MVGHVMVPLGWCCCGCGPPRRMPIRGCVPSKATHRSRNTMNDQKLRNLNIANSVTQTRAIVVIDTRSKVLENTKM